MKALSFKRLKIGAAIGAAFFFAINPVVASDLSRVHDDAQTGDIVFKMVRKGKEIGHHSVDFTPLDDGRLQVDVTIAIKVKFAFITAYRYEHRNREIWSADGATLLSIESETNNNGKPVSASGVRVGDVFELTDEAGNVAALDGTIIPTSYWNAAILAAGSSVINTQKGTLADVIFEPERTAQFTMPSGANVAAETLQSKGELQDVFVDYAMGGQCWVGLEFLPPKQDVKIAYELTAYFPNARPDLGKYTSIAPCLELGKNTAGANVSLRGNGGVS